MLNIDFNKYPFQTRNRHHTNPTYYIPQVELKTIPKGYPKIIEKINWSEYFFNELPPAKIDIGCGRGLFLLEEASKHTANILGVEIRKWCCDWIQNYIKGEQIFNCGIIRYCVANGLYFIEDSTIDEIFYLFPDPWVKTRHLKRRAFNINFLDEIFRLLKKGGRLYLATDVSEVHQYHLSLLRSFQKLDFSDSVDDTWDKPHTNKELFCIQENIAYHRIIASK